MFISFIALGTAEILIALGIPSDIKNVYDGLRRIGFVNSLDEIPTLFARYKENKFIIYEFKNCNIPLIEWDKQRIYLDTCFNNKKVVRVEYGKTSEYILVYTIRQDIALPSKIDWNDEYLLHNNAILVLGERYDGLTTLDLTKNSHTLIAGSTNSGKSALLKLILKQCSDKHFSVYIVDMKGGLDYQAIWRKKCKLVFTENDMLNVLSELIEIMNTRTQLFLEANCENIDSYNTTTGNNLPRIIFAVDELAEVLDKKGASKERKEQISSIEAKLFTLARLSRAVGIHLILATQRPSADILDGQIKGNMDIHICGKADEILSNIILGNTSAATEIPKDCQGRFLTNTGELFQAYYFNDKTWK